MTYCASPIVPLHQTSVITHQTRSQSIQKEFYFAILATLMPK